MSGAGRRAVGAAGEAAAIAHLLREGYLVLDSNWRCRLGELDIVAAKDGAVAFVEVRARSEGSLDSFGAPLESIDARKQAKLRRLAEAYIQRMRTAPGQVRFDCIAVVLDRTGHVVSLQHMKDAF